MITLIMP